MGMNILLKNESFQRDPSFTLIIQITVCALSFLRLSAIFQITVNSGEDDIRTADSHERHFMISLSRMLKDHSYGNVEFIFRNKNGQVEERTQKLYAFSHVWEHPAFANCRIDLLDSQTDVLCLIPGFRMRQDRSHRTLLHQHLHLYFPLIEGSP